MNYSSRFDTKTIKLARGTKFKEAVAKQNLFGGVPFLQERDDWFSTGVERKVDKVITQLDARNRCVFRHTNETALLSSGRRRFLERTPVKLALTQEIARLLERKEQRLKGQLPATDGTENN